MTTQGTQVFRSLRTLILAGAIFAPAGVAAQTFTTDFDLDRCTFAAFGRHNPYFSLKPGDRSTLSGEEDGTAVEVKITVLDRFKVITLVTPGGATRRVRARVIEERETDDGDLIEVSRNWFARCVETNDVFYFGEDVDIIEGGQVVRHDGSWEAGKNGAQPGIVIPARFLLGSRYYQEQALPVAADRSEHVGMSLDVAAAGTTFHKCVAVTETSPLTPGEEESKVYCPGVGLVKDDTITLSDFDRP
ncbi:MAG: hypothetical protein ABJC13_15885 [Acidobacteriota bacterium]